MPSLGMITALRISLLQFYFELIPVHWLSSSYMCLQNRTTASYWRLPNFFNDSAHVSCAVKVGSVGSCQIPSGVIHAKGHRFADRNEAAAISIQRLNASVVSAWCLDHSSPRSLAAELSRWTRFSSLNIHPLQPPPTE